MRETSIIRSFEENGTKFIVFIGHNPDYECDCFVKAQGRLNFVRPIQICDPYRIKSGSYFRYTLGGPFTLIEEGEEYLFDPSKDGWTIEYNGGSIELKGDKKVLDIISGDIIIRDVIESQKFDELVTEESKKVLAAISEMLNKNIFDPEKIEKISKYAEDSKDERIKDMIRILQKRFRRTQEKISSVNIQIVE
ncbi:MAG: hypothetical protein L6M37_05385 [Candidatus Methylarchaceae archaeon HK02M1]|nr:hypothetical protein [Candidatus Methylarchaceae archaeon HK01M]MCP8312365.1 hypothetical protein [Candidatus Methylarchaceae archaeon HK02M1]